MLKDFCRFLEISKISWKFPEILGDFRIIFEQTESTMMQGWEMNKTFSSWKISISVILETVVQFFDSINSNPLIAPFR